MKWSDSPIYVVFPIISIAFFVASIVVSTDEMTEDNSPLYLLFAFFGGIFGGLPAVLASLNVIGTRRRRRIEQHGIPGTGQILTVEETGVEISDQPQVAITLLVLGTDRPPYEVIHKKVVSRQVLHQLVPGAQLILKVDPRNHKRIMLY